MSVSVASPSPPSMRRSSRSRSPTSRSASLTPWWVYRDRPVTSIVTSVCGASSSSSSSSSYSSSRSSRSSGSSGAIGPQRSSRHRERIGGGGDVVHAEHRRAALQREDVGGEGAGHALVRVLAAGQLPEERLARRADDDREAQVGDLGQPAQQ